MKRNLTQSHMMTYVKQKVKCKKNLQGLNIEAICYHGDDTCRAMPSYACKSHETLFVNQQFNDVISFNLRF